LRVADSTTAVETVFRMEFPRVVAALARMANDLDLAEELAQEALVDALRQWPRDGAPTNPGAWLTAVGKRKAIDRFRRNRTLAGKYAQLGRELELEGTHTAEPLNANKEPLDDDRLRLIFVACHPLLPLVSRVALTLRLVGGLTTAEIARAYVVPEPTIAQRIVRAKRSIAKAGVPFEVPEGEERTARLGSVLEVIYLIFNEGYSATTGQDWLRPELCAEALRLGRILAAIVPDEAEVHGLVALMELNSSRLSARVGPRGAVVVLADQDRRRWDRLLIARGEAALRRADELSRTRGPRPPGGDRPLPRPSFSAGGNRLGRGGGPLRRARVGHAVADRRAQPSRRYLDGVWSGCRAAARRAARRARRARALPPDARGAGRPARQARAPRRGGRGFRARCGARAEHA
jgi:RNA polymerase sigma-70 factor (ECF subfamily)